jgi:hypothetical protein
MMKWTRDLVAVLSLVLLAGAAGQNAPISGAAIPAQESAHDHQLDRALHAWAHFPAEASPRPLVLLEGDELGPELGFPNDNSKLAYGNGQIAPPAGWPASPKSSMGLPIIGPTVAFKILTTPTDGVVGSPPPLSTTGVQLGSGSFLTDRGWRTLPAWQFSFAGVENAAKVLAVVPARIYSAPVTHPSSSPAELSVSVSQGGRRLTATFAGAPGGSGRCTASYSLAVKESGHAVAIEVISHPYDGPGSQMACVSVGVSRHATSELKTPLGGRVVVDATTLSAAAATPV